MKAHGLSLLALLSLTGCFEDKEAILAECRLKYEKNGPDDRADVMLCMSAKGYQFASAWTDSKLTVPNARCWTSTIILGKAIPTEAAYIMSDCYKSRSILDKLRQ